MRPGEPARSTLDQWLLVCRRCGTAAPDLADLPAAAREIAPTLPADPSPFLHHAALCEALGDAAGRAEAILQAAWTADDAGDEAAAAELRRQVADLWADSPATETRLRRLDVLRRSGEWDKAEALAGALAGETLDEVPRAVVSFQRARIAARDTGRHMISSALPPPPPPPHVTHVQARRPGLMARLFGRG
jgi:hypothetical protein